MRALVSPLVTFSGESIDVKNEDWVWLLVPSWSVGHCGEYPSTHSNEGGRGENCGEDNVISGEDSWLDSESLSATARQRWRQQFLQSALRMVVSRLECLNSTAKGSSPCGPSLNVGSVRSRSNSIWSSSEPNPCVTYGFDIVLSLLFPRLNIRLSLTNWSDISSGPS